MSATGATGSLTLRMRAWGAAQTARAIGQVNRSVARTGSDSKKSANRVNAFTRAVRLLGTRAVIAALAVGALTISLTLLSPALGLLIAAAATFGAVFIPAFFLAAAVGRRFANTVEVAGSAAWQLAQAVEKLGAIWDFVFSPAADTVLGAAAKGLMLLLPLVKSLAGPLQTFAGYAAEAIGVFVEGLTRLGPEIRRMFTELGPFLVSLAVMMVPLIGAFLDLAHFGLPVLAQIVAWLTVFAFWLRGAATDARAFFDSALYAKYVETAFMLVGGAAKYLAGVAVDLYGIGLQLYAMLEPYGPLVGTILVGAFQLLADTIAFVNDHFAGLEHVILPLIAVLGAYKLVLLAVALYHKIVLLGLKLLIIVLRIWIVALRIAIVTVQLMTWAWRMLTVAFFANPIGIIVLALVALVLGVIAAYKHSETFRKVVQALWGWTKKAAVAVKDGLGAAFKWAADKAVWLYEKLKPVLGAMKKVAEYSPAGIVGKAGGVLGKIPGFASGGFTPGGPVEVGERGRELIHPPKGSFVEPMRRGGYPSQMAAAPAGGDVEYVTAPVVLHMDGEPIARGTAKIARRRKSTR